MTFQFNVQEAVAAEFGKPAGTLDFSQLEAEVSLDWEGRDDARIVVTVEGPVQTQGEPDDRKYIQVQIPYGDIYDELNAALTAAVRLPA